jgi:hypothetical protein
MILEPHAVSLELKSPPIKYVFPKEVRYFVNSLVVILEQGGQYIDEMVVDMRLICLIMFVACMELLLKEVRIKCFMSVLMRMSESV